MLAGSPPGAEASGQRFARRPDRDELGRYRGARETGGQPLTPSIPGVDLSGSSACGNPFAINATTVQGTIALRDRPGFAQPTSCVVLAIIAAT